jgi:hypothetical protein
MPQQLKRAGRADETRRKQAAANIATIMYQATTVFLRQAMEVISVVTTCYGILAAPLAPDAGIAVVPTVVASSSVGG